MKEHGLAWIQATKVTTSKIRIKPTVCFYSGIYYTRDEENGNEDFHTIDEDFQNYNENQEYK